MTVTGGFEYNGMKTPIAKQLTQYFVEDGLGVLIPFLDRCIDDRTN